MRISVWSSDVCSADLARREAARPVQRSAPRADRVRHCRDSCDRSMTGSCRLLRFQDRPGKMPFGALRPGAVRRSEEHTSELQSLMRISYAVFCLKKKKENNAQIEQIS